MTQDFWLTSGWHLLDRDEDGRLVPSADFMLAYYARDEIAPHEESCPAERALHARLSEDPFAEVSEADFEPIIDRDVVHNYRAVLARAGRIWVAADPAAGREDVPGWMVAGLTLDLSVRTGSEDVWRDDGGLEYTSLAEEGGGFISRTRLVESVCRHFMAWVNRWEDDGFRPLHDLWVQRLQEGAEMVLADGSMADWVGLDEDGAALIRIDGRPVGLIPTEFESVCGPAELISVKTSG